MLISTLKTKNKKKNEFLAAEQNFNEYNCDKIRRTIGVLLLCVRNVCKRRESTCVRIS